MEPVEEQMTQYRIPAVVDRVFYDTSNRWFVHFAGSFESLCFGDSDEAPFAEGDTVDIIIRKR